MPLSFTRFPFFLSLLKVKVLWLPAFAGMTEKDDKERKILENALIQYRRYVLKYRFAVDEDHHSPVLIEVTRPSL